jgi:hypothetical protein
MDEGFSIEVEVERKEYSFEARLATVGYTHRFYVLINGLEVTYEPDEERNYRAMVSVGDSATISDIDKALIKAVGDKIQAV